MHTQKESNLRFNLRRFFNFLRVMLSSKQAALGLAMLIISVGAAVAGPVFYPQNPQKITSAGFYAQPQWVTFFPEGYYLSSNMVVINDPSFTSTSGLQELSYSYGPGQSPYVSISRSSSSLSAPPAGSINIVSSSSSPVSLTMSKTFHYPYHGPPYRFSLPPVSLMATGASFSQPVTVQLSISRGSERTFTLYSANITTNKQWIQPKYILDSADPGLQAAAGVTGEPLSLTEIVFSQVADYTISLSLTLPSQASVKVTNLGLKLLGTAFGILGTDNTGSDLFAQLLWGARISLFVGLLSAFIGIFLGLFIGLVAGFRAGLTDEVLMRFTDMTLTLPGLPLLLVLVAVLGQNIWNIIIIIGFLGWMGFARVIRSQVLSLKERPFIEAAKAAGAGMNRILTAHVFPNVVSLTYVNLALAVPGAILTEAALSFLGLGDPSAVSWGQIVGNAQAIGSLSVWWWVIPPGLGIAFVSLSFVLIGYSLDEIFNPKLRRRR